MLKFLSVAVLIGLFGTHVPNPIATHISAADILSTIQNAPQGRVSDQQIRHVDAGDYNLGVGVVQRPEATGRGGIRHHKQAEIYYIVEGSGTLVTVASMSDSRPLDPAGVTVRTLTGPSSVGILEDGVSRDVVAGDMVIIPADVAHGFSEIRERITYIVIRIDPDQLVELK